MKSSCSFLFSLSIIHSIRSYQHSIYGVTCSYSLTNSGALSIRHSSAKISCYKRLSEEKYSTATAKGPWHSSQPTNIMLEAVTTTPATRYNYLHAAQLFYANIFIFVIFVFCSSDPSAIVDRSDLVQSWPWIRYRCHLELIRVHR